MRIEVDPGGLETPSFASIDQEVAAALPRATSGLAAASGASGDAALAAAIDDLAETMAAAGSAAALSLSGLATAVARAGARYRANEAAICQAEMPR